MPEETMKRIETLRERIDELDAELVKLLNERARIVQEIRSIKKEERLAMYDPKREEEIFEQIADLNEGPLYDDSLKEIFDCILHFMKEL